MTDWTAAAADYLGELSRRPAARSPATLGEIWNAEWARSGLDTISGIGRPFNESYEELRRAIEQKSGSDIATLAYRNNVNIGAAATPDQRIAALNALADTLPEEQRKELEPLRDVRRRAADKAIALEKEAAEVGATAYGLSGIGTMFLAGVARQALDPYNLAANVVTAPVGGPFAGPVLRVIARQGLAGGAAQLLVEPYIQAGRAELGLESGAGHAALNVAQAALGAAGLAGLLRAGKAGFDLMRGPRAGPVLGEAAPDFKPTFIGHLDADDVAAFDRGEIIKPRAAVAFGEAPDTIPGFAGSMDIAEGAGARPTRDRAPAEPPPPPSDLALGPLSAEDVAAFDRGHAIARVDPLGDDAPGLFGRFDIAEGARAGPTRDRTIAPDPPPSDFSIGPLSADDVAAFDRGHAVASVQPIGEGGAPWGAFDGLTSADLEAAARLAERDQLIDRAAPAAWDRAVHGAMVDEAAAALEQGRPLDRGRVTDALREAGVAAPQPAPIADNAVSEAVKPPRRFGVHATPEERYSLFQFLASRGGLNPDQPAFAQGWLQTILDGNPFVPGFGRLLRKGGLTLDRAWQAAIEAGYLNDPGHTGSGALTTNANDLLRLIEEEGRGNRQYRHGEAPAGKVDAAEQRAARDRDRSAREAGFDARMAELEITKVTKRDRTRALQIMEKEGQADPLLAFEQALQEIELRKEALRAARQAEYDIHVPGWDVADDARAASPLRDDAAGEVRERSGEPGSGGEPRAGGESAGAESAGTLGDPALAADAERAIAQAGEDFEISIRMPDGSIRRGKPHELLAQADEDARAAAELNDCIGGTAPKPEGET